MNRSILRSIKIITTLLVISIAFFACEKEMSFGVVAQENTVAPDLTTKISSSVSGFVTDENNAALAGASISVGTSTVVTDSYGYFEIRNVQVVKNAAVVTVMKAGYFPGIKTYAATQGKKGFFRIKLIPKSTSGSFNASTGGAVALPNGLGVSLPASAVVNAATGAAYTGTVNVASFWINPLAADLTQIMPGDLRGLDNAGSIKGLTTYGMAAVELRTPAGEKLQVAPGKKATITMPMTGNVLANAPSSIPLWYFDESNGLWKQEGSATKTGGTYVGEVSHFSYWNCDLPNAIVPLTFTVVNAQGNPLANVHVEIIPTTPGSWSHIGGYTDSTGYVSVFVTPNNSYMLTLINSGCNSASYTQAFSAGTTAVSLGTISLGSALAYTLAGTITDCNNAAVSNGYVLVQNGSTFERYNVSSGGSFSFSTLMCSAGNTVTIAAVNADANQQSQPVTIMPVAGINPPLNLQACTLSATEFINYNIDGADHNITGASAFYTHSGNNDTTHVYGSAGNNYVDLVFVHAGIGINSMQQIQSFRSVYMTNSGSVPTTVSNVHITEYGAVGAFIAGSFTATSFTSFDTPPVVNTITCSFRVRRTY